MKIQKNLLLTFDFELFLGSKSGSVENCLIKPTRELMKIVNNYKLSMIFFVDTLYLSRLKDVAKNSITAKNDYLKIISLLQDLIDSGSYIFHHIHPHWLDAIYLEDINQWDVSNKNKFALNNLTKDEVVNVFDISNEIIHEIYKNRSLPKYFGYRAGGLYAQPFSNYKDQMKKHSILLEFSVLKNAKSKGEEGRYEFDYSTFPSENIYNFSQEVNLKDENGEFIEFTMDNCQLSGFNKIVNSIYYRLNHKKESWKRWGDGSSSGNVVKSSKTVSKLKGEESFSIELLNNFKANVYFDYLKNENFLHVISHPKFFSNANLIALDKFLVKATSKYTIQTDVFNILAN